MLVYLAHPFYQGVLVAAVFIAAFFILRFDTKSILTFGFFCLSFWMLAGLVYNFMIDRYWTYLWQSMIAYLVCAAALSLLAYIGESVLGKNGGMAWVGLMAVMNIFVVITLIGVVGNGIRSLLN